MMVNAIYCEMKETVENNSKINLITYYNNY